MNLGKHYSKSIIDKFDYIPVYLPDTKIRPGAILSFGTGFFGGVSKPLGAFDVIGNLIEGETFNFPLKVGTYSSKASFSFVSQDEVSVSVVADAKLPNVAYGDIQFDFGKKGSILLHASRPTESRIEDHFQLWDNLGRVPKKLNWAKYYIVTSVITCSKALIYQSKERNGMLIVSTGGQNIDIEGDGLSNIGADVSLDVKWKTKQAISVDWAEDVVLFMKLARFTKKMKKSYEQPISNYGSTALEPLDKMVNEEPTIYYRKIKPSINDECAPDVFRNRDRDFELVEVNARKLREVK